MPANSQKKEHMAPASPGCMSGANVLLIKIMALWIGSFVALGIVIRVIDAWWKSDPIVIAGVLGVMMLGICVIGTIYLVVNHLLRRRATKPTTA